jgi:co-chaperonin GroES (HSP10)
MLQPLGKRILITAIIPEKKESFLILKDATPQTYKVLAIGDDVKKVNIDDTIFIAAHSTADIKYNDEKFQIVFEDNIIAKVVI